jgi:redox-sensitive bicupin YhaK (pirin superfamily)
MAVWDIRLAAGGATQFDLPAGWNAALVVLRGSVQVNGSNVAREAQWVQLDPTGGALHVEANPAATVLLLAGEPLGEPIVGHGPFVMNSEAETAEAIADFNGGRFGQMPDHRTDNRR